ncbi:MAG: glycoside hydrolase family 38 C-terminal domain-containing protein [Trueperaceae bacterium]|nr:glycoside hydrolase family 38 C-terminal domain-containing protein [Trueperaceae bacterium]
MALTLEQRIDRLAARVGELRFWLERDRRPLDAWLFNGQAIEVGQAWPTRAGVVWLEHPQIDLPEQWPLDDVRLRLDLGGEALLQVGYANQTEAFGLDPYHQEVPVRERRLSLSAKAVARLPFGVPNEAARLERAEAVWLEDDLAKFVRLLDLVRETAGALHAHDSEVSDALLGAAETALASTDWPSRSDAYIARVAPGPTMQTLWRAPEPSPDAFAPLGERERNSVIRARTQLQQMLKTLQQRFPPRGQFALSGHAHLDLAWLWPLGETRRKAERTFSTVVALMERYPEFKFNQSSAQLYALIEEDNRPLFEAIRRRVKAGQWELVGGMWVEPDANMPCGESLARQLLYGQRYFARHFAQHAQTAWLPDCFGFTPALPQLLRHAGIDSFMTTKLVWNETNPFPHDLFWWEGLDGSRVLSHSFDNPKGFYNASPDADTLRDTWNSYRGKRHHPESLLTIGYGDGGGGPTEAMLRRVRDLGDMPALPRVGFDRVQALFRRLQQSSRNHDLPVWVGELYLELHRGTLTSQGRTKRLHRQAERRLLRNEVAASMVSLLGLAKVGSLEPLWRLLLRQQFHDILPGSSIREVYERAESELADVIAQSDERLEPHLGALDQRFATRGDTNGVLVLNPELSARPLRIRLEPSPHNDMPEQLGAQRTADGWIVCSDSSVAGLSVNVLHNLPPPAGLAVDRRRLENRYLRVELAANGSIERIFDKQAEREVLAGRGNQLWAYVDKPREWDAWDIDADYRDQGEELTDLADVDVSERGPHRVALTLTRRFRHSTVRQQLRLWANSARLEFVTDLDWHDRHYLLKTHFPLNVRSDTATFETAFGVVRRATHRNTSFEAARFEVAGHRFADLSEPGYGVALLNDGRYGYHARGNDLGLSLLRAPTYPDPYADEGEQRIVYALLPHSGDWLSGGVLHEAEDLNNPLVARAVRSAQPLSWQAVKMTGLQLGLGCLKPSEEGDGLILRAYEPQGARGTVGLELPRGWQVAEEVDGLERPLGEPRFDFGPFQLRSWRLRQV